MTEKTLPKPFIFRRIHSLTGIWLTIFLMQHLLVNSQAAYFFGHDGKGFIQSVNSIRELPYLPVIEFLILALPILVHGVWGLQYLWTAKYNSFGQAALTDPILPYPRNRAYTWQRITSYLLVIGIVAHVVHMRFLEYPSSAAVNGQEHYMVLVNLDDGLYTLAKRLDVKLYDQNKMQILEREGIHETKESDALVPNKIAEELQAQEIKEKTEFLETLEKYTLKNNQAIAVAKDFGTAELLMVRETFKIPIMMALYTVFVLAACFHGFNGLWTFLISWGVIESERSMRLFLKISYGLMLIFSFLGLSAIYATYLVNLKQ